MLIRRAFSSDRMAHNNVQPNGEVAAFNMLKKSKDEIEDHKVEESL